MISIPDCNLSVFRSFLTWKMPDVAHFQVVGIVRKNFTTTFDPSVTSSLRVRRFCFQICWPVDKAFAIAYPQVKCRWSPSVRALRFIHQVSCFSCNFSQRSQFRRANKKDRGFQERNKFSKLTARTSITSRYLQVTQFMTNNSLFQDLIARVHWNRRI